MGALAVALGLGVAVVTGTGVAWAEPGNESSTSDSGPERSVGSGETNDAAEQDGRPDSDTVTETDPADDEETGSAATERFEPPDDPAIDETLVVEVDPADDNAPVRRGGKSDSASSEQTEAPDAPAIDEAPDPATDETPDPAIDETPDPEIGEADDVAAPVLSRQVSVPVPPPAPEQPEPEADAPVDAPISLPRLVADLAGGTLFGTGPGAPIDSPAVWALLAFTRREIALQPTALTVAPAQAPATTSLFVGGNPISVLPVVPELVDGVIRGDVDAVDASGLPLTYTVVGAPSAGGKVLLDRQTGEFSFLPYGTVVSSGGTEKFGVLIAETTPFTAFLQGLPIVGAFVPSIVTALHQAPILNVLLSPLIGHSATVTVNVDVGALAPGDTPVAFTVHVLSFDGTPISTNFFPASGLQGGQTAPTVLNGPGLGSAGNIDPDSEWDITGLVPGLVPLRDAGYNVITWDPRGEHASGGVLQLDSPFFEGRDVSAIIDWAIAQGATTVVAGDPLLGMVGGSYGGGIQLVTAGIDDRVDAIVPGIAWNSLNEALYPNQAFKTSMASLLLLDLVTTGARINGQIYAGILSGALFGFLTPSAQALLASSGPTVLVNNITAPTLLVQGTVDVLFTLRQSVTNAQMLAANGVPVKMIWYCGGHGVCLDPVDLDYQDAMVMTATLAWLDQYVKGDPEMPADDIPRFQFVDQNGDFYSSDLFPFDPGFAGTALVSSGAGGLLAIAPVIGGSGPQTLIPFPYALPSAAPARNALSLTVPAPSPTETTRIVGAPELTLTYQGLGTGRFVYAQLVDDATGLVVGNLVSPIPVILDGRTRTVTVPMESVVYTMEPGDSLTLQVTSSATAYENFLAFGAVNVSEVQLSLPTVAPGVLAPEFASAVASAPGCSAERCHPTLPDLVQGLIPA